MAFVGLTQGMGAMLLVIKSLYFFPGGPDFLRDKPPHTLVFLEPWVTLYLFQVRSLLRSFVQNLPNDIAEEFGEELRKLALAFHYLIVGDVFILGLKRCMARSQLV